MIFVAMIIILATGGFLTYRYVRQNLNLRNAEALLAKRSDISITIVEGKRREEIAAEFEAKGICTAKDFLIASASVEGHLFPDTYRFFPNTPAQEVVNALTSNFDKRTSDLTVDTSTLVLASIVERESINDADRPIIAEVYLNRIKQGMKLQADPTVVYAKATNYLATHAIQDTGYDFWPAITRADYQSVTSPFNTYLVDGLPPSPICDPGIKSIEAVITPAKHNYLYFGYKNGKLLLATTLSQHEAQLQ